MSALRSHALVLCAVLGSGCAGRITPPTGVLTTDGVTITADDKSFAYETNKPVNTPFAVDKCPKLPVGAEEFPEAERLGAQRVRVTYPGVQEPLYGVLLLCKLPSGVVASDSPRYSIQIPKSFVDATEGGRVSLVFEGVGPANEKVVSWMLWLSRIPFARSKPTI